MQTLSPIHAAIGGRYHGVFEPNSPLRKKVTANAQKQAFQTISDMQDAAEKIEKVSSNWAKLIARIYEVNPLTCTGCGKNIRIISFVTHREAIWRVLRGIGLRDCATIICTIRLCQSPGIERSKVTQYYNMGSLLIVQSRELSHCPIVQIIVAQSLKAVVPEFDPAYDITDRDICQLVPGTKDGFPEMDEQFHCDIGPDPPHEGDYCDPTHWQD